MIAESELKQFFQMHAADIAQLVVDEVRKLLATESIKDNYTTDELADALGKSSFTIREHWCRGGRIDAQKEPATGRWLIPGKEFQRLVSGGLPRPATK